MAEPGGARVPADPERLAEAERRIRAASEWTDRHHRRYVELSPADLRDLLAEYDRRGAVEKAAAAYVHAGLCGDFEIPDGGASPPREVGRADRPRPWGRPMPADADETTDRPDRVLRDLSLLHQSARVSPILRDAVQRVDDEVARLQAVEQRAREALADRPAAASVDPPWESVHHAARYILTGEADV